MLKSIRKIASAAIIGATVSVSLLSFSMSSQADESKPSYVIDASHSSIQFSADHLGYSDVVGRFNQLEGAISTNKNTSVLNVVIQAASIDSNHQKRDDHLRSPDFFNVKQFPQIKFTAPFAVGTVDSTLTGELEMLGKVKPITLTLKKNKEGKDPWGMDRIGYTATTSLKRSEFGMNFMQGGIGDEIDIVINIEAIKK